MRGTYQKYQPISLRQPNFLRACRPEAYGRQHKSGDRISYCRRYGVHRHDQLANYDALVAYIGVALIARQRKSDARANPLDPGKLRRKDIQNVARLYQFRLGKFFRHGRTPASPKWKHGGWRLSLGSAINQRFHFLSWLTPPSFLRRGLFSSSRGVSHSGSTRKPPAFFSIFAANFFASILSGFFMPAISRKPIFASSE